MQITIEPLTSGVSIEASEVGFPVTRTPSGGFVISGGTIHYGQNRSFLVRVTLPPGSSGNISNFVSAKISYKLPGGQSAELQALERSGDMSVSIKVFFAIL